MKPEFKKNIVVFIVALIIMFFFIEIILHLTLPAYYGIPPYTFVEDSELDYIPNPNFKGIVVNKEHARNELPVVINSFGFRDKEFVKEKGDVLRLVTIGDSETFPDTLLVEEQYGKVVEVLTNNKVESLNLGVSGYGTLQSFNFFKRVGEQFDPDVVSYLFVPNDISENVQSRYALISGSRVQADWKNKKGMAKVQIFVYRNSFIARELYRLTRSSAVLDTQENPKLNEVNWDMMYNTLQEMQEYFSKEDIKFVVIISPFENEGENKEIESRLLAILNELNIEYINPTEEYIIRGGKEFLRWKYDSHLNSIGHKLLAELLTTHLS